MAAFWTEAQSLVLLHNSKHATKLMTLERSHSILYIELCNYTTKGLRLWSSRVFIFSVGEYRLLQVIMCFMLKAELEEEISLVCSVYKSMYLI